jgi:hypothetical protein
MKTKKAKKAKTKRVVLYEGPVDDVICQIPAGPGYYTPKSHYFGGDNIKLIAIVKNPA